MANDPDARNGAEAQSQRFVATLSWAILGQLVGNNSVVLAKAILHFQEKQYDTINEVSAQALMFFVFLGVFIGGFLAKRGWGGLDQVVVFVFSATIVATFTFLDQGLPAEDGDKTPPFVENFHYLGWYAAFLVLPLLWAPWRFHGDFAEWARRRGGLLVVTVVVALAGLGSGGILEMLVVEPIFCGLAESGWLRDNSYYRNDPQRFWMARPFAVNLICGMYVVVAFSGVWWRDFWRSASGARWLAVVISVVAVVYAGFYGWYIYAPDAPGKGAAPWMYAMSFGTIPIVAAVVVLAAWRIARRNSVNPVVGWPVSRLFWWLLPVGFSLGFALCPALGFALAAWHAGATNSQIVVLVAGHAINGLVFGVTLRIMTWSFGLIPGIPGAQDGEVKADSVTGSARA